MRDHIYKTETDKSPSTFACEFKTVVEKYAFIIGNEPGMDMQKAFSKHGSEVGPDFDLHMIQVCKPDKGSKSLTANPERAILMPEFVMAFSQDGKTQIRFHHYSAETIAETADNEVFPGALAQSYEKIISMIDATIAG